MSPSPIDAVEALDGLLNLIEYLDKWYEPSKHLGLIVDSDEMAGARRVLELMDAQGLRHQPPKWSRQALHNKTREIGLRERSDPKSYPPLQVVK